MVGAGQGSGTRYTRGVPRVIALVDDLMFLSRLREAAGTEVVAVRGPQELLEACRSEPPALVVLDLDSPRVRALEALQVLRAGSPAQVVATVGFFSHVHPERGRDALAAGCGRVLPRSAFVKELPALLAPPA